MKKSAKSSASKPESKVVVSWKLDEWDEFIDIEAREETGVADKPIVARGGFIGRDGGDGKIIWKCSIGSEETCCGFPVMESFWNPKISTKVSTSIGEQLKEHLTRNCVYMSAYVPDNKEYAPTRAILEAAGFKRGITLDANYGKYTNTRWEWFTEHVKEPEHNEKVVRSIFGK